MANTQVLETARGFRARLVAGDRLLGTFVKSLSYPAVEVLADAGLDFVVIDAEHAPYDRGEIDRALLAAHACRLPALVRVPSCSAQHIGSALDSGAAGILAPHIRSGEDARALVAACRYRHGSRGYSNSPRAGGYGRLDMAALVVAADETVSVVAQIEDVSALGELADIFSASLDACFIGRADLAISTGAFAPDTPEVAAAVDAIAAAARAASVPLAVFMASPADLAACERLGATVFVIGSDLSLMRRAAGDAVRQCAPAGQ